MSAYYQAAAAALRWRIAYRRWCLEAGINWIGAGEMRPHYTPGRGRRRTIR